MRKTNKKIIDFLKMRLTQSELNKKMARARRLFYTMHYSKIIKYVSFGAKAEENMIELGVLLRSRGLYAPTTSRYNLGLSVMRNLAREREKRYGSQLLWTVRHSSRMRMAADALAG
jgi:hypothetical protein